MSTSVYVSTCLLVYVYTYLQIRKRDQFNSVCLNGFFDGWVGQDLQFSFTLVVIHRLIRERLIHVARMAHDFTRAMPAGS